MKIQLNLDPVKNWLGFTRRERRSTSILLLIILVIIACRFILPEHNISISEWGGLSSDNQSEGGNPDNDGSVMRTGFVSDSISDPDDPPADSGHKSAGGNFTNPVRRSGKILSSQKLYEKIKVDLNRCDTAALISLPGIGPVLSVRIIKYRNLLGGYVRVEQLKEVYGLSGETYELIKDRCFADTAAVRRVNINTSGYKELCRVPYLEKYEVAAILKYREIKGSVGRMADLTENNILSSEKAEKSGPYIDFR